VCTSSNVTSIVQRRTTQFSLCSGVCTSLVDNKAGGLKAFLESRIRTATVGTPVTQRPPCSPGRAVFPHPVPRLHALPRRVKPCLLWPAGRVAHTAPVRHVRDECPVRAACFRRVLPHVGGFPHRRLRRSIRLPNRLWRAFP